MSLIATDGLESALRGSLSGLESVSVHLYAQPPKHLAEILSTLHRQSADISNIKAELSQCITKTDLSAFEQSVIAKLQVVEQQVQSLERDVAVDAPSDSLTEAGEQASATAGDRYVFRYSPCCFIH